MTLDDLLKERICMVIFESVANMPTFAGEFPNRPAEFKRLACSIRFHPEGGTISEGVSVTTGQVYVWGRGNNVAEAFSEAIQRLRKYEETAQK
jgi:hypothetical protein